MEYSVSLYSFYSAIQKGELTPLGCVEKAAELGFDAVEAVDFVNFSGTQEEKKAQALELKQAAEKCGLQFSSLAIGADFLNGSDGDREKEIQRVKDYVDIAALLGAPRMRHDITAGYKGENYRSYESLIPTLAQAVREVADYAASQGRDDHDREPRLLLPGFRPGGKAVHGGGPSQLWPAVRFGQFPVRR